ncbi:hypothetical protein AgCh_034796 [Apium graveolens]
MDPGLLDVLDKPPENADRVKNMLSILKKGPLSPFLSWHSGRSALISQLYSFHTPCVRSRFYCGPNATAPPPLVRYCADDSTLDIVFPDWSFWGWIGVKNHNKVTSSQTWQASVFRGFWPFNLVRKKLQLVGITALLLACKYKEVAVPVVEDLIVISDRAYNRIEVLEMDGISVLSLLLE